MHSAWCTATDLRLGQLLVNAAPSADATDDEVLLRLRAMAGPWPLRRHELPPSPLATAGLWGRPRDPARIPPLVRGLEAALAARPQSTLMHTVYELGIGGVDLTEDARARVSLIEDDWWAALLGVQIARLRVRPRR